MTVSPVGFTPIAPPVVAPAAMPTTGASGASGDSFATALGNGLNNLQTLQTNADSLAVQAATGQLTDVHQFTMVATQAQLATELTVAVRNKAVEAFNDILKMPL
jgi:flagellar hook-basal body complex protein FliE